jgi:hypothetical protein
MPGIFGWEKVDGTNVTALSGQTFFHFASCPTGKKPVGGGVEVFNFPTKYSLMFSGAVQPFGTSGPWTWGVVAYNFDAVNLTFRVNAICATVS